MRKEFFILALLCFRCHCSLFNWTWIESENLTRWFQPWELCIVESLDVVEDIKDTKRKCMELHGIPSDGIGLQRGWGAFRCRAGGLRDGKFPCRKSNDSSMGSRAHLRASISGYDDPSQMFVQEMFIALGRANGSLLIIGDSAMKEIARAITCEVEREGLRSFSWISYISGLEIVLEGQRRNIPMDRVVFNHLKLHTSNLQDLHQILHQRLGLENQQSMLILFNLGLWYNDYSAINGRAAFKDHLLSVLNLLNSLKYTYSGKKLGFLWAETTAQHFPSQGRNMNITGQSSSAFAGNGYHTGPKESPPCAPIERPSSHLDWRNNDANAILTNASSSFFGGASEFLIRVPMRQWSEPLWDIHPVDPKAVHPKWTSNYYDCTHFCYTPMMYQPVFKLLRDSARKLNTLLKHN